MTHSHTAPSSLNAKKLPLWSRAIKCEMAYLRYCNLHHLAKQAYKEGNTGALLEFCADNMPLIAYLATPPIPQVPIVVV